MARMFGTDGVRGIANKELSPELAMRIGAAGTRVLTHGHSPKILIGSDERRSRDMLFCALTAGILSMGGTVYDMGVIPTPSLPYLTKLYKADAAVMISASHNPMQYNGIKWFDSNGFKLPDAVEDEIEKLVKSDEEPERPLGEGVGTLHKLEGAREEYISFLCSNAHGSLSGLKVALDCANGAASKIAPEVFRRLDAEVFVCAAEPDGTNINKGCGSTHIENLQEFVKSTGADIGFAFDGDADRVIAVNCRGEAVNGDLIMGISALAMKKDGRLKNNTLALTVMSNLGLKKYLRENGIAYEETAVGDRYVLEAMLKHGLSLGGEQSGHIIYLDSNTTGDGILSAIQLINAAHALQTPVEKLADSITMYPQVLVNVKLSPEMLSPAFESDEFRKAWARIDEKLGSDGRTLVRLSGTEPLIRIMLEGPCEDDIIAYAHEMAAPLLKEEFGGVIRDETVTR